MELIKALAIALHEDDDHKGKWPEKATEVTQVSAWTVEFDEEVITYRYSDGRSFTTSELEIEGLPYIEDYETGDTITKEEYENFMAEHPTFYADMMARRPELVKKIAELNKQVGALVNEITALAEEAGVEVVINLGQHGELDPNSDWDSSRC